jgi:predicted phosphodiesterase
MAELTKAQAEAQDAIAKHGSQQKAAEALGISRRSLRERLNDADKKRMKLFGTSTLYDKDGEVVMEWEKRRHDSERQEQIIRETVAAFVQEIKPAKPVKTPKNNTDDILTSYVIGDAHIGMYAWAQETGSDFNVDIACHDIKLATERLVAATPPSREALVVQLGDFFHADSTVHNNTPMSGNSLDVDSRFPRVIRAGITTMRYVIDSALEKHETVHIRNVAGNHDPSASITLNEALRGYYHKEPRLILEDSPAALWYHVFGSNLIGVTHGHGAKAEKLPGVLAVDAREYWSETEFKYIWHGHIHNKRVFEDAGCTCESFRTLASKDKWNADMGYRSGREMQAIILHKDYGEIERHTCGIKMVRNGR